MSDDANLARPYAKAAFEWALQADAVASWSDFLTSAANVADNAQFQDLATNPKVSAEQIGEVLLSVFTPPDAVSPQMKNFIHLLARNQRLLVLSDIAHIFSRYRDDHAHVSAVTVVSAMPIAEEQKSRLQAALKIRLQHDVTVQYQIDETVLGGAQVRIGDYVIDGTVKGKLQRMVSSMSDTTLGVVDV